MWNVPVSPVMPWVITLVLRLTRIDIGCKPPLLAEPMSCKMVKPPALVANADSGSRAIRSTGRGFSGGLGAQARANRRAGGTKGKISPATPQFRIGCRHSRAGKVGLVGAAKRQTCVELGLPGAT